MEETNSINQGSHAWMRDIMLLCCVLRLRCQPSVPFEAIADIILSLWRDVVEALARQIGGPGVSRAVENGIRSWFIDYLRQSFEHNGQCSTELLGATRAWAVETIQVVLDPTELDTRRYRVMEDSEVHLQLRWKQEGSWKAGSTPDEPPRP